jgi:Tol biopolymer transport system component
MDIDGGNPKQLTGGTDARWPRCAPDSHWVLYASIANPTGLFKVSIDGGEPVRLTDKATTHPTISPDGKLIACGYFEEPGANRIAVFSFDGGAPLKIFSFFSLVCWTTEGRNLTYINGRGVPNIVNQSIEGGQPKQITFFKDGQVVGFDWSRDGKLACSRKVVTADAVMINDLF